MLGALLISANAHPADAETRFTHRFALELSGSGAYYTTMLPQSVYAASQRGDLGDLRVLNGADEPVPYTLETAAPELPTSRVRQRVAWFPLPTTKANTSAAPLGVTIATDGSLHAAAPSARLATSHDDLIDLGRSEPHGDAIWIHLRDIEYQGRVSVEQSDDLRDWQPLSDAQVLRLTHGDNRLVQERVSVSGLRSRYLRLHWLDDAPDIESVELETTESAPEVSASAGAKDVGDTEQWRSAVRVRAGQSPGEYLFETDGAYPVDGLRFGLPQPNTVASVTIDSRVNAQQPWQTVQSGTLFRLRGKLGEQGNEPLTLPADTDRQWRLQVDMRNGGLGGGLPTVAARWRPGRLTFVARGDPPFTLAVGNAALAPAASTRDALLISKLSAVMAARVGAMSAEHANTAQAAQRSANPDATRRYVLWGALVLAVGALGTLAARLARGGAAQENGKDQ
ncbi:DUF3999 domain-containing protein [Paraburkholderia sp. J41]|uniref:DUF3999 domain-containing protein n=1 Tax=Paraburkholderia sp. J41 TaxID=2805433 RepID=UPI0039F5230E